MSTPARGAVAGAASARSATDARHNTGTEGNTIAEINVVERNRSVWRWLIPALIVLALIGATLSMRDDGTRTTSGGAVADTTVSGTAAGTATP